MSGIASYNLCTKHGTWEKTHTLMRDCFSRQIFNLGIWEILNQVKCKEDHGFHITLVNPN